MFLTIRSIRINLSNSYLFQRYLLKMVKNFELLKLRGNLKDFDDKKEDVKNENFTFHDDYFS